MCLTLKQGERHKLNTVTRIVPSTAQMEREAQTEQYAGIVLCLLLTLGEKHKMNTVPEWFYVYCTVGAKVTKLNTLTRIVLSLMLKWGERNKLNNILEWFYVNFEG